MSKEIALDLAAKLMDEGQMAKANAETLLKEYGVPFTEAGALILKSKTIKVKDENDNETMALARETRLALRKHRITIEKRHDELKVDSLRTGRAIDLVQRVALAEIKPVEEYLELEEKFAETKQEERRQARIAERTVELSKYTDDVSIYNYGDMADDAFAILLEQVKNAFDLKNAAAEKEEADRLAAEKKEAAERKKREEADRVAREKAEAETAKLRATQNKVTKRNTQLSMMGMVLNGTHWQFGDVLSKDVIQISTSDVEKITDDGFDKFCDKTYKEIQARKAAEAKIEEVARQKRIAAENELQALRLKKEEEEDAAKAKLEAEEKAREQANAAPDKEKLLAWIDRIEKDDTDSSLSTEKGNSLRVRIFTHLEKSVTMYRELIEKEL